ncbi:hypothetical protein LCGC14_2941670, partial [marine sediment metagenome]
VFQDHSEFIVDSGATLSIGTLNQYGSLISKHSSATVTISVHNKFAQPWSKHMHFEPGASGIVATNVEDAIKEISVKHDYKEWHIDGIDGSNTNNGRLNTPVKTLQAAIDLWEADPITKGVITIHHHTGIGNGILTAIDSNVLTIQGTGGVFAQSVDVLTINDGVNEDIPLILRNIEVTTLNIVQTGVLNNGFISYNAVVRTLNITANNPANVTCTVFDNSEIKLSASQTFNNISVLKNSRIFLNGSNTYTGTIGVSENSSLYVTGATPSITTLIANQSHISIGTALTVLGDFTHIGVSFDNYAGLTVSGNQPLLTGEWAEDGTTIHDYKIWHIDVNNGLDTNGGEFNTPVKTLQKAIDLRDADATLNGEIKFLTIDN